MDNDLVREAVHQLVGKAPWDVQLGWGSFITFEFGKPVAKVGERRQHGEWHLWLYMCHWRIRQGAEVVIGSSDERDFIGEALDGVVWGDVIKADLGPALDISLLFSSGRQVETFACSAIEENQWILYTPEGSAITVNGGSRFDVGPIDGPDEKDAGSRGEFRT